MSIQISVFFNYLKLQYKSSGFRKQIKQNMSETKILKQNMDDE